MKKWLPVLVLLAGLGSSISSAQAKPVRHFSDPFNRYLKDVKNGLPETSMQRFSTECGVDPLSILPRFAVGPGSSLTLVKNLARGLRSIETDFYSTAEVWVEGDRVLVELWTNSEDVGSEVRYYKCFAGQKLHQAEVIEWNVPVFQSPDLIPWGYSRRWERSANGGMQRTKAEFVDEMEKTIPKPKLDKEDEESLRWIPLLGPLNELKLSPSLLR
jgi:hypothetical protein